MGVCTMSRVNVSLGNVHKTFETFKETFSEKIENGLLEKVTIGNEEKYVAYVSIGNPTIRARILKETSSNHLHVIDNLYRKTMNLIRKRNVDPKWIKIDFVNHVEEMPFQELEQRIRKTRRNYFRFGISFDPEFRLSFLEQELNGNAMLRSIHKGPVELHEKNINHYLQLQSSPHFPFIKNRFKDETVYTFTTISSFSEVDETNIYDLYNGSLTNGIRKVDSLAAETQQLITKSTYYLVDQVKENGQFEYGYFSAFGKRINTYNILRHSSSLYSMAEGYEVIQDEKIIQAVKRGIDYLIREAIVYKEISGEDVAFVVDHANAKEIKLGSNATAILAMTKYMEMTHTDTYLKVAQALAKGILEMKMLDGRFIHVLTYPTYEIKDMHRIIYYEGEAVFALLRLYAIDKEEIWLNEAKKAFDYFIVNEYWKHHDHWLSYAANEITMYDPEDKYFIFGLKNCHDRLNFIYHRETTFPTFLELTMAAYKMIATIKRLKKDYLLGEFNEEFLHKTIDRRAEYQRVGFFYPELAMYKKNPALILNGFFIRHHSFRVRIDDVEHYLSGYCQYYHHRISDLPTNNMSITDV